MVGRRYDSNGQSHDLFPCIVYLCVSKEITMSTKHERALALINARDFIRRLISPYVENGIKRIPKEVRRECKYLLKHFPSTIELIKSIKPNNDFICINELKKIHENESKRHKMNIKHEPNCIIFVCTCSKTKK